MFPFSPICSWRDISHQGQIGEGRITFSLVLWPLVGCPCLKDSPIPMCIYVLQIVLPWMYEYIYIHIYIYSLKTGFIYVSMTDFKYYVYKASPWTQEIYLLLPPKFLDQRYAPPNPASYIICETGSHYVDLKVSVLLFQSPQSHDCRQVRGFYYLQFYVGSNYILTLNVLSWKHTLNDM